VSTCVLGLNTFFGVELQHLEFRPCDLLAYFYELARLMDIESIDLEAIPVISGKLQAKRPFDKPL